METTTENQPSAKAATPLMQQYLGIKQRYAEEIVFFRLGDFYEMFFEDAIRAAPILEVVLTQRQSIPMCGVPYHAMTSYLSKLLKAGVSVAIAEQLEDPQKTKGMVKRDVVRVVTPGTLVEDELLPSKANNFLAALTVVPTSKRSRGHWALAVADVSTGRQWVGEAEDDFNWNTLKAQMISLAPSEILLVGEASHILADLVRDRAVIRFEPVAVGPTEIQGQVLEAIRRYLHRDHSEAVKSLLPAEKLPLGTKEVLFLDETAVRHLELVNPSDPLRPGPTLFSILDRCSTALGSRLLRWWLLHPSLRLETIKSRLDQVEQLIENSLLRGELRRLFGQVADLERITVRALAGTASPRDLTALRTSLQQLAQVPVLFSGAGDDFSAQEFTSLLHNLEIPRELSNLLQTQLADEPPLKIIDGGVIRDGANADLDELRRFRRGGKKWIAEMEAAERERTGIGSLKVGYNDVFGYYLEVSKTNISKVPPEWIRKQTLANGERYITPELKDQEEKILGAEEKIAALEAKLFAELIHQVAAHSPTLFQMAEAVAHLDAVASLAEVAVENHYIRPVLTSENILEIKGGRHPIVERQIGRDRFIPNDVQISENQGRIAVITGPNMAGKSTYLRQNALIVIMAQMGSFVPAQKATIGLVDQIFTRIGASDRLAQGQSTFMVEMQEVATLLAHATERSLLILDEVGRGTSTYDGISIAWAVVEYLSQISKDEGRTTNNKGPRTFFATHYFELTQLEGKLPGIFNAHATAKEWPGPDGRKRVVFLYQILPGAADRSYGIHVAEMAGLPAACINRAREILHQLESGSHVISKSTTASDQRQLDLFAEHPVLTDIRDLNLDEITPLEALHKLAEIKSKII